MGTINYVIATFNGRRAFHHSSPHISEGLKIHLKNLSNLKHNIAQITIMKPKVEEVYPGYYNIGSIIKEFDIPVKIIECENYAWSMGQFLDAADLYLDNFDYHLFIEDDYCPNLDHFDNFSIGAYLTLFPDNIGVLSSITLGDEFENKKAGYPPHWEGMAFVSSLTLKKVWSNPLFRGNPKEFLNRMEDLDDLHVWDKWKKVPSMVGGYYQMAFSHLFTLSGIKHDHYTKLKWKGEDIHFPYWSTGPNNDIGGEVLWFSNNAYRQRNCDIKDELKLKKFSHSLFIPVQLTTPSLREINLQLESRKIIFLVGMHRSGTSLLSNCLFDNGFEIGVNHNHTTNWQNPKGYFENDSFTQFHERLLTYNNSTWHNITRKKMEYTEDHVEEYCQLINKEFPNQNRILIKDPRLTFFQDFLSEVCEKLECDYSFLFCTRDREECTTSLSLAQSIAKSTSETLYDITHKYNNDQCLEINHRDLIKNNKETLQNISRYCRFDLTQDTTDVVDLALYRNRKE